MSTRADIPASDGWFKAEDKAFVFTITNAAGSPMDITGWTIQWRLAATQFGAAILTKTATLTTPASGICTVVVGSDDTADLSQGTYWYTTRRMDSGSRAELAYGSAVLNEPFTDG
jgi:hypothetical protein